MLRVQTNEYIEFISRLIENASIMNKNFYIIVPLERTIFPPAGSIMTRVFSSKSKTEVERIENFEKSKEKLDQRVNSILVTFPALAFGPNG